IFLIAAALVSSAPAMSRASEKLQFDIVEQPLVSALREFAEQANMQLLYKHDAINGIRANRVVGTFEKKSALEHLLRGTGLECLFTADDAATVRCKDYRGDDRTSHVRRSGFLRLAQADTTRSGVSGAEPGSAQGDAASRDSSAAASTNERDTEARGPSASLDLEEIVVTARRREERAIDVGVSLNVFDRRTLETRRLTAI